jgi:LysM repeat protein
MGAKNNSINGMFAAMLSVAVHAVVIFAIGGFDIFFSKPTTSDVKQEIGTSPKDSKMTPLPQDTSISDRKIAEVASMQSAETQREELDKPAYKVYVVKPGDNLTRIAEKDKSTFEELAILNRTTVKKLCRLQVGQKIKLKNGVE